MWQRLGPDARYIVRGQTHGRQRNSDVQPALAPRRVVHHLDTRNRELAAGTHAITACTKHNKIDLLPERRRRCQ